MKIKVREMAFRFRQPSKLRKQSQKMQKTCLGSGGACSRSCPSQTSGPQPSGGPKPDAIVAYMQHTQTCFQDRVMVPIQSIVQDIRAVRNHVMLRGIDFQEHHKDFVEKLERIDDEAGKVIVQTKCVCRRFQTQLQKVTKKSEAAVKQRWQAEPKSVARQDAGKMKAASLKAWQDQVRVAKQSLEAEGYAGTFNLKKGSPMHNKILELKAARPARASAACSGGSGAPGSGIFAAAAEGEVKELPSSGHD